MEYKLNKDSNLGVNEPHSKWSGPWTIEKLDALEKYVGAYLRIMKNNAPQKGWKVFYFDAFAGSGDTGSDKGINAETDFGMFSSDDFEEIEDILETSNYKGAAERVLGLDVEGYSFDYFYFVDNNKDSLEKLENKLKSLYPQKSKSMSKKNKKR